MSRGPGYIQKYLTEMIFSSPNPLTFAEIMAITYPPDSLENDLAKTLGGANVGAVRSLRRALKRLCDDGTIMPIGAGGRSDPHRYWLNPMMVAAFGDKEEYRELSERIDTDPALLAAANAAAARLLLSRRASD
jgi:hypothetical protein